MASTGCDLLLEDGTSVLLLEDGTSHLLLEGCTPVYFTPRGGLQPAELMQEDELPLAMGLLLAAIRRRRGLNG